MICIGKNRTTSSTIAIHNCNNRHVGPTISVRKMKWDTSTVSKTTDGPRVSPLGDHPTIKDNKGDQRSGGETTDKYWSDTAHDRLTGDGMLRPSPNNATLRVPNDDDDFKAILDIYVK